MRQANVFRFPVVVPVRWGVPMAVMAGRRVLREVTTTRVRASGFGNNDTMSGLSFEDANAFHRTIRRFASTGVGGALLRPTAHHLDRLITKVTGGRGSFVGIATGIPAVMLTTTGAKSGEPRTVAVYGIPHPDGVGLIASNFGGVKHPAWYYNLKAHPGATVAIGRDTWHATARLATPTERDEIWAKGLEMYPGWRKYETRAGERHIEAFVLSRD
jgi:deazaflavin-dependent oxidoreductase (nitroreductase family)